MRNTAYFLASFVFTLMIVSIIGNNSNGPTGYAVTATKDDVSSAVSLIAAENPFQMLQEGAELCFVVQVDSNTTYYYSITRAGDSTNVAEQYCADPGKDNIIIKFNSYDDLISAKSNPVAFVTEKRNTGYYIFPSNYMQAGGLLKCTESFQQKYCAAFYVKMTSSELANIDLACCANYELTAEQKAKIEQIKTGKPSILQSPIDFLFSTTGIIAVISVIVIIVVISSLFVMRPKNPLSDYVKETRNQGYSDEEIMSTLQQSGWDDKTINESLKK